MATGLITRNSAPKAASPELSAPKDVEPSRLGRILRKLGDRATQSFLHPVRTIERAGQRVALSAQERDQLNTRYPWANR